LTYNENLGSTAQIAKHPIHPMLVPFPIVCFVGTLVTDIAYASTAEIMWADFSAWLVSIGGPGGSRRAASRAAAASASKSILGRTGFFSVVMDKQFQDASRKIRQGQGIVCPAFDSGTKIQFRSCG
jgi:Predicted membrane protein (DUF2231)